jgi:hypothetical protein
MAMRTALSALTAVALLLGMAGRLPAQTTAATNADAKASGKSVDEIVTRFTKVRSIQEIDRELQELVKGPKQGRPSLWRLIGLSSESPGQANLELFLEGWGRHGSWYDLAVARYVWKFWPRVWHDDNQIDDLRLIQVLKKRIEEQPKLFSHVFWYAQWERHGMKFKDVCEVSHAGILVDGSCVGSEFPAILFIAGAIGQPELLATGGRRGAQSSAEELCDWWIMTGFLYFRAMRPFLRYDAKRHIFVNDEAAERDNRYLKPQEQEPVCPSTPLPDWDGKLSPEPPPIEK